MASFSEAPRKQTTERQHGYFVVVAVCVAVVIAILLAAGVLS
jgi:hypothetical protein